MRRWMDQGVTGAIHDIFKAAFILSVTRRILPQYHCYLKGDYDELLLSTNK